MTSQPGKLTIAINILPNTQEENDLPNLEYHFTKSENEIWSVIEYNMKIIFLQKSYTKWDREIIRGPFST